MGWLYMKSLGACEGPKQYLDELFSEGAEVLKSEIVDGVYYAAFTRDKGAEISAIICRTNYDPTVKDGWMFGYKNMHETEGPVSSRCPKAILDLLTPTNDEFAQEWRQRCGLNLAKENNGKSEALKPKTDFVSGSSSHELDSPAAAKDAQSDRAKNRSLENTPSPRAPSRGGGRGR